MYIYRRPKIKHLTVLSISVISIVVTASVLKSLSVFRPTFHALEMAIGGAWVLHLVLSFTISLLLMLSVAPRWFHMRWCKLRYVQWFLIFAFCLDEGAQYWIPTRYFSWLDLAINISGLVIASLLIRLLSRPYLKDEKKDQA